MRKKRPQNTTGAVAGYVRVSDVKAKFPPDCLTYEQRAQFVENLRRLRMAELIADAERQGEVITEWYDDMGVSARGEFLVRRVDFDRAREGARAGRLRKIYARDLSRLFRDLVQQELWFAEMDGYGCAVSIQDLPFIADEATRILLRQNLGSLNQYMATKTGQMLRANHGERVRAGLWVGRGTSVWGLTYNKETHHYDFDPLTADKIRFLLETLAACGGVAGAAARHLNEAWDGGHPRATLTPQGKRWTAQFVLRLARNRLYGREVHYFKGEADEILLPRPDLIPEVVEPALIARVRVLLAARAPQNLASAERARAARLDYTYSPFLACGVCGGKLRTNRPKDFHGRTTTLPGQVPRWLAWTCKSGTACAVPQSGRCGGFGSVQQSRIDSLVGAGVRRALELYGQEFYGEEFFAEMHRRGRQQEGRRQDQALRQRPLLSPEGDKANLEAALAQLDTRRRRFHLMFADEQIKDKAELDGYLREVEGERGRILARLAQVAAAAPAGAAPGLPALTQDQWQRFLKMTDTLWAEGLEKSQEDGGKEGRAEALNLPKYELLQALGVTGRLHGAARTHKRLRGRRDADGNPVEIKRKRVWGRIALTLEVAALGFTEARALTLTESEEAYAAYRRWVYKQQP